MNNNILCLLPVCIIGGMIIVGVVGSFVRAWRKPNTKYIWYVRSRRRR